MALSISQCSFPGSRKPTARSSSKRKARGKSTTNTAPTTPSKRLLLCCKVLAILLFYYVTGLYCSDIDFRYGSQSVSYCVHQETNISAASGVHLKPSQFCLPHSISECVSEMAVLCQDSANSGWPPTLNWVNSGLTCPVARFRKCWKAVLVEDLSSSEFGLEDQSTKQKGNPSCWCAAKAATSCVDTSLIYWNRVGQEFSDVVD